VTLEFRRQKKAKAVGSLAATTPRVGDRIDGVLVTKDFGAFFTVIYFLNFT